LVAADATPAESFFILITGTKLSTETIRDPDDPRVLPFRSPRAGEASDPLRFVAETEHVVRRLLTSGLRVEALLLTPGRLAQLAAELPADAPVYLADPELFDEIVRFNRHRGVAALARRPLPVDPLAYLRGRERSTVVVAEAVADPVNIGAILRSARAFGADLAILGPGCGDPWSRRGVRAAIGNSFTLPIATPTDLPAALEQLRAGLEPRPRILAAALAADAIPLPELRRGAHVLIALGNEGEGLSPALLEIADARVIIPIGGAGHPHTVAAAAAILLYALR